MCQRNGRALKQMNSIQTIETQYAMVLIPAPLYVKPNLDVIFKITKCSKQEPMSYLYWFLKANRPITCK